MIVAWYTPWASGKPAGIAAPTCLGRRRPSIADEDLEIRQRLRRDRAGELEREPPGRWIDRAGVGPVIGSTEVTGGSRLARWMEASTDGLYACVLPA